MLSNFASVVHDTPSFFVAAPRDGTTCLPTLACNSRRFQRAIKRSFMHPTEANTGDVDGSQVPENTSLKFHPAGSPSTHTVSTAAESVATAKIRRRAEQHASSPTSSPTSRQNAPSRTPSRTLSRTPSRTGTPERSTGWKLLDWHRWGCIPNSKQAPDTLKSRMFGKRRRRSSNSALVRTSSMAVLESHQVSASQAAHRLLNRLGGVPVHLDAGDKSDEKVSDDAINVAAADFAELSAGLSESSVSRLSSKHPLPTLVVVSPSSDSTCRTSLDSSEPVLLSMSPSLRPIFPVEASNFEMVATGTSGARRSSKPGNTSRVRKYDRDISLPSPTLPRMPLSSSKNTNNTVDASTNSDDINTAATFCVSHSNEVSSEIASLNAALEAAALKTKLALDEVASVQAEFENVARRAAKQLLIVGLAHANGRDCPLNPRSARITLAAAAAFGDDQVVDFDSSHTPCDMTLLIPDSNLSSMFLFDF